MSEKNNEQFSKKEAQQRMEAALRGARIAGHKEMKDIMKKNTAARMKKRAHKARKKI